MQPSLWCLDGVWTLTILYLSNSVILAFVDNCLFFYLCFCNIVYQCPSNTATATSVDKAILRTGVESILSVNELRMQNNVTLLTLGFQVGQTIPCLKVLCAGDTGSCGCRTQVTGLRVVMTLGTEHSVNPTIFVLGYTHIVNVCCRHNIIGHGYWFIPETEVIYAVRTLGHSEIALTVGSFHTHNQQIFALPFQGAGIQCGITHNALHQIGVIFLAEIVLPLQGHVFCCNYGILVLVVDSISPLQFLVFLSKQLLVVFSESCHSLFKIAHIYY